MFHPRNWTWTWLNEHCAARFGVRPQPRALADLWGFDSRNLVKRTGASRIIFTNGLNDGWSVGGIKVSSVTFSIKQCLEQFRQFQFHWQISK